MPPSILNILCLKSLCKLHNFRIKFQIKLPIIGYDNNCAYLLNRFSIDHEDRDNLCIVMKRNVESVDVRLNNLRG